MTTDIRHTELCIFAEIDPLAEKIDNDIVYKFPDLTDSTNSCILYQIIAAIENSMENKFEFASTSDYRDGIRSYYTYIFKDKRLVIMNISGKRNLSVLETVLEWWDNYKAYVT